jgi:hypothetical protein
MHNCNIGFSFDTVNEILFEDNAKKIPVIFGLIAVVLITPFIISFQQVLQNVSAMAAILHI